MINLELCKCFRGRFRRFSSNFLLSSFYTTALDILYSSFIGCLFTLMPKFILFPAFNPTQKTARVFTLNRGNETSGFSGSFRVTDTENKRILSRDVIIATLARIGFQQRMNLAIIYGETTMVKRIECEIIYCISRVRLARRGHGVCESKYRITKTYSTTASR